MCYLTESEDRVPLRPDLYYVSPIEFLTYENVCIPKGKKLYSNMLSERMFDQIRDISYTDL